RRRRIALGAGVARGQIIAGRIVVQQFLLGGRSVCRRQAYEYGGANNSGAPWQQRVSHDSSIDKTGWANRESSAVSQCGRENDLFAPPPQGRGRTPVRVQSARTNLTLYAARAAKSRQAGSDQVDDYGYTSKAVVGRLSCLLYGSLRTSKNAWIC